jgi:hypothetical protein
MSLINYIGNRQECLDNNRGGRGNAPAPIYLDYLLVGGGQYGTGSAGGGGGVVSGSIRFLPRFTLDVTVGDGGSGSIAKDALPSTLQSVPNEFFVYAGGGRAGEFFSYSGLPQSNPGGGGSNYSQNGAGGSGASGSSNADSIGGAGGSGSQWAFDSGSNFYGGGGGGVGRWFIPGEAVGGAGGVGGGGQGAGFTQGAGNGTNYLGGGGGGTDTGATNGGTGIVKLRYISGSVMGATGGTITVSGSYVYHTFKSSSQFVYQP